MRPKVSVIIPCYNASQYIEETLDSIFSQKIDGSIEVILIDDGSTDNLKNHITKYPELQYFHQVNSGVSAARNYGFRLAVGEYVLFFDADDIMPQNFINDRLLPLIKAEEFGFCCGPVECFPKKENLLYGAARNIPEEVLLYNSSIATCPSNYLIRRKILIDHNISFNENLSSSADRFYLLELNKVTKGLLIEETPLLYRISKTSMSHHISETLIGDSHLFLKEVKKHQLAPKAIRNYFFIKIYYILGAGYIRVGKPVLGIYFLLKRFLIDPLYPLRKTAK